MHIPDSVEFRSLDGNVTRVDFGEDGVMRVRNSAEVQAIIDDNTVIRNNHGKGIAKGAWRHVARLPNTVYADLITKGIIGTDDNVDRTRFRQWLNDRDNRAFRASEGKV